MTIQERKEVESIVTWGILLDKVQSIILGLSNIQIGVQEITIRLKGVQLGKETK